LGCGTGDAGAVFMLSAVLQVVAYELKMITGVNPAITI
jgi:hypothetical protein